MREIFCHWFSSEKARRTRAGLFSKRDLLQIGDPQQVEALLARLASSRLLTTSVSDTGRDEFVEVSHEALIRNGSSYATGLNETAAICASSGTCSRLSKSGRRTAGTPRFCFKGRAWQRLKSGLQGTRGRPGCCASSSPTVLGPGAARRCCIALSLPR